MVLTESNAQVTETVKNFVTVVVFLFGVFGGLYVAVESLGSFLSALNNRESRIVLPYGSQGLYGASLCVALIVFIVVRDKLLKLPVKQWATKMVGYGFILSLFLIFVPPILFKIFMESKLEERGYTRCMEFDRLRTTWANKKSECNGKKNNS